MNSSTSHNICSKTISIEEIGELLNGKPNEFCKNYPIGSRVCLPFVEGKPWMFHFSYPDSEQQEYYISNCASLDQNLYNICKIIEGIIQQHLVTGGEQPNATEENCDGIRDFYPDELEKIKGLEKYDEK